MCEGTKKELGYFIENKQGSTFREDYEDEETIGKEGRNV